MMCWLKKKASAVDVCTSTADAKVWLTEGHQTKPRLGKPLD
jgi:hypothetical protein